MKLNCDLGEKRESPNIGEQSPDANIMPLIDMANIACGGHAGDQQSMRTVIALAKQHSVVIGAHPSYPDKVNFGRVSMALPPSQLRDSLNAQIQALLNECRRQHVELCYVKPHGALYNDMMQDSDIFTCVCATLAAFNQKHKVNLALMIQALTDNRTHQHIASDYQLDLLYEAFADRAYQADGRLLPRSEPGALMSDRQHIKRKVQQLIVHQEIQTHQAEIIKIKADSLCVHGDTDNALAIVKSLRRLVNELHEYH